MAQSREGGDLFFSSQGYLTAGQVAAIADEHRKNNHMCNIHRAWNLNKSLSPGLVQKIVSPFGKSISTFTMDNAYQV